MDISGTDTAAPALRWGVVGTGWIAQAFIEDLSLLPNAELVAVGSRSQAAADAFANKLGIKQRHSSYQDLFANDEVEAVYIATPNPAHYLTALAAIEAGKHVLCEKPFTMDASQARKLVEAARERGVFLMEAMWMRFLPHIVNLRAELDAGRLGDIRMITADLSHQLDNDPKGRALAPELGGGTLLDLGIYPVSLASMILGPPARITAVSDPAETGVDAQTSMLFQYEGGRQAVLTTTLEATGQNRAAIIGTKARIEIESNWHAPSRYTLISQDGTEDVFAAEESGNGLRYQAAHVARCIADGKLESTIMPLDETIEVMRTVDEVRRQIGLIYPI